jgi:predicted hotdog family 3-hydroxylacyl-ACP dehydratase
MSLPPIAALVPHAGPMVLLDRALAAGADTLCAEVRIQAGSMLADGGGVGAWVGIEYMAQAIAAHAGWLAWQCGEPIRVGFLLGTRKYAAAVARFAVGEVLHVHVQRVLLADNGLGAYECRIDIAGGLAAAATATVTVFRPDNVNQFLANGSIE